MTDNQFCCTLLQGVARVAQRNKFPFHYTCKGVLRIYSEITIGKKCICRKLKTLTDYSIFFILLSGGRGDKPVFFHPVFTPVDPFIFGLGVIQPETMAACLKYVHFGLNFRF